MGLGAWLETALPDLGTNTTTVKPINEGEPVTVVADQPDSGGVWGFLDKIGEQATSGVGSYIQEKLKNEFDRQTYGPEASEDNAGDPYAQSGFMGKPNAVEVPFGQKYKTPLLIGAGVLSVVLVVSMMRR